MTKRSFSCLLAFLLLGSTLVTSAEFTPALAQRNRRAATAPATTTTTKKLRDLQTRITGILQQPQLSSAMIGIKVVSLDTGRVLFEDNARKLLRPASNMKLYTVTTALDRLSPDFRFTTSVYAAAQPDAEGTVQGDLTIYGRGDPSLAARFNNGDYFKGIDDLAAKIAAAGVKHVAGDLVGDESYFTGPQYGSGWEWEDLQWYYGAEVSALTVNDNALDLFVKPGPQVGTPALITTGPPDPLLTIANHVMTGAKGTKRELTVQRGLGGNIAVHVGVIGSIGCPLDQQHRYRRRETSRPCPPLALQPDRAPRYRICDALQRRARRAWMPIRVMPNMPGATNVTRLPSGSTSVFGCVTPSRAIKSSLIACERSIGDWCFNLIDLEH